MVAVLIQPPFAMVHCKIFTPNASPVTELLPKVGVVTVPLPARKDQVPIPVTGIFPVKTVVGLLTHKVWFPPASAVVGKLSTLILMVEELVPQPPPLIVHCKTLIPRPNPVTELVANVGVVMVPVPDITDHVPAPLVGVLAAKTVVGLLMHRV